MSDVQSVLYVEDEPIVRELVAIILEDADFELVTAEDGVGAFHALDEDGDAFRALITDINLADGLDGWAVPPRARASTACRLRDRGERASMAIEGHAE